MVDSWIPPESRSSKDSGQMTPSEMEEQIKTFNEWAGEVAQYLPLLSTKKDLKAFATKEDLKAYATHEDLAREIAPLATKEDVEASKRYTESLILVTRREIRQLDDKVSSV